MKRGHAGDFPPGQLRLMLRLHALIFFYTTAIAALLMLMLYCTCFVIK